MIRLIQSKLMSDELDAIDSRDLDDNDLSAFPLGVSGVISCSLSRPENHK